MPFGDTGIIRTFTQANGVPSGSSAFAAAGWPLAVVSNQLRCGSDATYTGSYWATTYSGDVEHFADLVGVAGGNYLGIWLVLSGSDATPNGYKVQWASGILTVLRLDNGVEDDSPWSNTISDPDKLGIERIADEIAGYYDTGSGWAQFTTGTDNTYPGDVQFAIDIYDPGADEQILDNEGGGEVGGGGGGVTVKTLATLGVG